jgi:hypothetical protein
MAQASNSSVEVVYATPDEQHIVELPWESGMTAAGAVERSGLPARYSQIDQDALVLGIFGRRVANDDLLSPGDRVEICRPLTADPRQMRRSKLAHGDVMGRGAGAGVNTRKQERA